MVSTLSQTVFLMVNHRLSGRQRKSRSCLWLLPIAWVLLSNHNMLSCTGRECQVSRDQTGSVLVLVASVVTSSENALLTSKLARTCLGLACTAKDSLRKVCVYVGC